MSGHICVTPTKSEVCPTARSPWQGFLSLKSLSTLPWVSLSRGVPTLANSFLAAIASSPSACLGVALNIFQHTCVMPSAPWGAEFSSGSPLLCLLLLAGATRRWSRCLLRWPRGSPVAAVHIESGWPDAQMAHHKSVAVPLRAGLFLVMGDHTPLPVSVSCCGFVSGLSDCYVHFHGDCCAEFLWRGSWLLRPTVRDKFTPQKKKGRFEHRPPCVFSSCRIWNCPPWNPTPHCGVVQEEKQKKKKTKIKIKRRGVPKSVTKKMSRFTPY